MDRSGIESRVTQPAAPTTPTRAVALDSWLELPWTDGCQVDALSPLQAVTVTTRNSVYEIIVTSPRTGGIKVRGGQFFPEWSEATLAGCSMGGSFLKMRGLYAGFCMELHFDGQVVITTRVRTIAIHKDAPGTKH
jgi:hypothetical protein